MATITRTIRIAKPVDDVWNVLGDVGGIGKWISALGGVETSGDPGLGAERTCTFAARDGGDGGRLEEKVTAWEPGRRLSYVVEGALPVRGAEAHWTLRAVAGGQATEADYVLTHAGPADPAGDATPAEAEAAMGGMIDYVLASFRSYVEEGKVLPPPAA